MSDMSYIVSSTAAGALVIQGPRLSAAIVLTKFPGANELIYFKLFLCISYSLQQIFWYHGKYWVSISTADGLGL